MFDDRRWDGTVVTLPACLCVISEQTTLSPACREASSRRLRKGARKRGQSARHFLLTAQEPGDDTPSSRSARRCHVFMPGCTWVNLRWRRRSGRRPSITSVGIFWLQWWQDRWCRESDRGIQTALRDVSVHGASEEQPHNKPAIITPSGHPARAWREAKPCRGGGGGLPRDSRGFTNEKTFKSFSRLQAALRHKKKEKKKHISPAFITNIQSLVPVVRTSSCGGDRIMFRNVWGNLRMIPHISAFTCQRWQPETCQSRT